MRRRSELEAVPPVDSSDGWLEDYLAESADGLRRAFVARYGVEVGCEVHAETMVWAVSHRTELAEMANPTGYLFRVGQSSARKHLRWSRRPVELPAVTAVDEPRIEPGLPDALAELRDDQRTAVLLVHGFGWSYAEVAELLDTTPTAVTNHVHRGLSRLRRSLGVDR